MASSPDEARAKLFLEKLKVPVYDLPLTKTQQQAADDQIAGRKLWEKVLKAYHQKYRPSWIDTSAIDYPRSAKRTKTPHAEALRTSSPFRFLDFPPEIRNKIYEIYFAEYDELRASRMRNRIRIGNGFENHRDRWGQWRHVIALQFSTNLRDGLQKGRLRRICKETHVEEYEKITRGAKQVFDRYTAEYELNEACYHDNHYGIKHQSCLKEMFYDNCSGIVLVNGKGNYCGNLPPLCLTNREIFQQTFVLFHAPKVTGLQLYARVRHF